MATRHLLTPSAGEQAYYAYWQGWPALPPMPFNRLCREERRAWEAAGQAVLAAWQQQYGSVNGTQATRRRPA